MDLRDDIEYLRSEFRIEKSYSLIHDQNTIIMMILNDLIYSEFGYELGLSAGHSSRVTRTSSYSWPPYANRNRIGSANAFTLK